MYEIPVDSDKVDIDLFFQEIYWEEAGKRRFDVLLQGEKVIEGLDLFAESGQEVIKRSFTGIEVVGGVIRMDFQTLLDNAKVSAIYLKPLVEDTPEEEKPLTLIIHIPREKLQEEILKVFL